MSTVCGSGLNKFLWSYYCFLETLSANAKKQYIYKIFAKISRLIFCHYLSFSFLRVNVKVPSKDKQRVVRTGRLWASPKRTKSITYTVTLPSHPNICTPNPPPSIR